MWFRVKCKFGVGRDRQGRVPERLEPATAVAAVA